MIIHPTRTNLLILKDKANSVINSIELLKARRNALMKEFLKTTLPFLRSRDEIRGVYKDAIDELTLAICHEGEIGIKSLTCVTKKDMTVEIIERSLWGLRYKDVTMRDKPVRKPDMRGYDHRFTNPHIDEGIYHFEKVIESMLEMAEYECKLKRLGDEITMLTRRIKVLEERVLKEIKEQINKISLYINERERESYYRLKRFSER
ncbi:MAG: hypothetical protein Fur0020_16050 [Thermodesulfovibrionia bacterium]